MAVITEVAEQIYEIKPEGNELARFPLCTVYLVVDNKIALVETGVSNQIPDIQAAVGKLGYDINNLAYIMPTHVHMDHAGGAGHLSQGLTNTKVVAHARAAKVLTDATILKKLMYGFRRVFGDGAISRYRKAA
jgi:glyoxylase-like metal-dependent hydrolase (beta-lactamase superfamily II)